MTDLKPTAANADLAEWFVRRMDGGETWLPTVRNLLAQHAAQAADEREAQVIAGVQKWQPMDMAPTDGTWFLAAMPRFPFNIMCWDDDSNSWMNSDLETGMLPLSWMSLPPNPYTSQLERTDDAGPA